MGSNVTVPWWVAVTTGITLICYGNLDVSYFVRMAYTLAKARYIKKKCCFRDITSVDSYCLLNDIDTLCFHMNNARYLRELDFARADFYERCGLYSKIRSLGGSVVQSATTIRYRRYLQPFCKFIITSQAIYWDEKYVYMEHKFIGDNGFVHAIALCRQRVINADATVAADAIIEAHCDKKQCYMRPNMTSELELWLKSNDVSSVSLRRSPSPKLMVPGDGDATTGTGGK